MSVRSKDSGKKKRTSLFEALGNSDSESGSEKHEKHDKHDKEQLEAPSQGVEPASPSKAIQRRGTVRRIINPFSSLDSGRDEKANDSSDSGSESSFVKEKEKHTKKHKKKDGGSKLVADPTSLQISFPYETWIMDYYSTEGNDLNDSFLLFPTDDIIMAKQQKVHRTSAAKKALESNEYTQLEYHVKDLIKRYCNDFSYLVKNYAEYQKVEDDSIYDLPIYEYDEESNDSDSLLNKMRQYRDYIEKQKQIGLHQLYFEYIQMIQSESDVGNSENRMQHRIPVFHAFASDFQYLSKGIDQLGLCFEKPAPAQTKFVLTENSNSEHHKEMVLQVHQSISQEVRFVNPMKLCVRVKQLSFALGELEPFFATLALYNIKTKQKLSEDFHFHTNNPSVLSKYFDSEEVAMMKDPILQSIFTIAKPSEDIHIVLKIEKILQGDIEDAQEPYCNLQQHGNEAAKKKLSDAIESGCHRLVAYRQPFAWSSMQLFTSTGAFNFSLTSSVSSSSTNSQIVFKYIYRTSPKEMSDEALLDLIVDSREHTKSLEALRKKTIPGVFVLTISEWKEEDIPAHLQLLDPSLDIVNKQYFARTENMDIDEHDSELDSKDSASFNSTKSESDHPTPETKDPNVSYSAYGTSGGSLSSYPTGVLNANNAVTTAQANTVREIQEFADVNYYRTHSNYVNNLYVYCTSIDNTLSSKKGSKNLGVRVEIKEDDSYEGRRLKNIYNKASQFEEFRFVDSVTTQVTCGTRQPEFSDEIKIKLPARITHRHHILFTFFNVQVKQKKDKKNEEDLETPIGYAYLPLYAGYKISDEEHHLPVFTQKAEDAKKWKNYLTDKELSYMDGGKAMFSVKFRLVSSVFTQDKHMASFFQFYGCPNHIVKDQSLKAQLMESIRGLKEISLKTFIEFHPIILNGLFTLMSKFFADSAVPMECLKTVLALLAKLSLDTPDPQIRSQILQQYVNAYFDLIKADTPNAEYIFTAITETLLMYFIEKKAMQASVDFEELRNIGTLFSIILKSMALKVVNSGELHKDRLNRAHWFSDKFVRSLKKVCSYITSQFTDRCTKAMEGQTLGTHEFKAIIEANKYMALFIRDLCSVLDRGAVLDMILSYTREILPEGLLSDSAMGTRLLFFKYDFQKIICEYEHFIPMNFPVNFAIDSEAMQNLRQSLALRHPLISMLLDEIKGTLETQSLGSLRVKVFQNLNLLLAKHDYDSKYQTIESKNRLATLYFQLIPLLMDDWNTVFLTRWRETADIQEKRNLYISIVYILKNIPKTFLLQWWQQESRSRLLIFLDLLADCVAAFEYQSSEDSKDHNKPLSLEKKDKDKGNNARRKTVSQETGNSLNSHSSSDSEKGKTPENKSNSLKKKLQTPQRKRYMEGAQNHECSVTILDTIEEFVHCFYEELAVATGTEDLPASETENGEKSKKKSTPSDDTADIPSGVVLDRIFALLVLLLRTKQSVKFYQLLFATYRSVFVKFRHIFFMDNRENSYCSDVSFELLRYCNSSNFTLRDEASSLLYLLVKYNQQVGNFRRISIQLTTALAKLVSDGKLEGDPEMFEMSLNKLCSFALYDYSMPDDLIDMKNDVHPTMEQKLQFVRQSEELSGRLTKILKHTITVQQVKQNSDHELICDLYYRIAKAYTNTPELRVTWLEALFRLHDKQGNYAEAAICMVHVACVIGEYLVQTNAQMATAINLDYLKKIAPYMNEVVEEEESGLFSPSELLNAVRVAIHYFSQAEMYEFSIILYKFLIPLLERQSESYTLLSKTYDETAKLYEKLLKSGGSRLLGKYYRVGFYGIKFDELNNKEFLYREPKSAHLYEITDKLKNFYGSRFGEDNVVILKDSKEVDKSKLDPYKNYLQITSVEPYFDSEELDERKSFFDRNTLLSRFVFTTPFTLDGRTQGAVDEQYIRKTILQVDSTFPSLLKRTPVAFKSEIVLTPIENAVEAMNKMNNNVSAELNKHPVNAKALQGLLQGSILASVNEGPIEFCQKFLGNKEKYPPEHVERLSSTLRNFLLVCEDAIVLNKTLIEANQQEFQLALEQGLRKLARRMSEFLGGKTLRGKLPKKIKTKTSSSLPSTPNTRDSTSRARAQSKSVHKTIRKPKLETSETETKAPEAKPIQVQVTKLAPSPSVANAAKSIDSEPHKEPIGRSNSNRELPRVSTITITETSTPEQPASTQPQQTLSTSTQPIEVVLSDELDEEEERLRREEEELLREEKELSTKILIKTSSFLTQDDDSMLSTASSDNE